MCKVDGKKKIKKERKIDRQLEADHSGPTLNPWGCVGCFRSVLARGSVLRGMPGRIIREFLRERATLIKIVNASFLRVLLSERSEILFRAEAKKG